MGRKYSKWDDTFVGDVLLFKGDIDDKFVGGVIWGLIIFFIVIIGLTI